MSNNKMKGLLKGLRYISQIFDNEKEPEMQIGFPTDVKHVAHIGWDGPSVNSPSWMNGFKAPESNGEAKANGDAKDDAAKWVSEDASSQRGSRGSQTARDRDLPELPKSSRRHSSSIGGTSDSLPKEKSEKKHSEKSEKKSRKSSRSGAKDLADGKSSSSGKKDAKDGDSSSNSSDLPKKARRKKSKDSSGKSSRSKEKASDADSESGSVSKSLSNIDTCDTTSVLSALEEDDAERLTEVS